MEIVRSKAMLNRVQKASQRSSVADLAAVVADASRRFVSGTMPAVMPCVHW